MPGDHQREVSSKTEQMELSDMQDRAIDVRRRFREFETATYGREWTTADLISGLVTDVGDLAAAVQRVEGIRPARQEAPIDEVRHELGDCLWVLLVLANRFQIDLGDAFQSTMDGVESWIDSQRPGGHQSDQ